MENEIVKRIRKDFKKTVDLVIKPIKISLLDTIYVIYLESVTGSDKVNDYILKNVSFLNFLKQKKKMDLASVIPAPNTKVLKNADEIEFYLTNGFTIVIHKKDILALETRAEIQRGIPEPTTEQTIFGPKDAFTENIQINLDVFLDLNEIEERMKIYDFTRILGILLDNAIDAAVECEKKIINVTFRKEMSNDMIAVIIQNTYNNKDVDTETIYQKGVSSKANHSGLGLWKIRQILMRNNNLNLFTTKNDEFFTQQFEIFK